MGVVPDALGYEETKEQTKKVNESNVESQHLPAKFDMAIINNSPIKTAPAMEVYHTNATGHMRRNSTQAHLAASTQSSSCSSTD